jgi:hypothetical protein
VRFGSLAGARGEPYLLWLGGFIVVLAVLIFVVLAKSAGRLPVAIGPPAFAAEQLAESSPAPADRTSCSEIGRSDLQLPSEGLWYQSNCIAIPELPLRASTTTCNKTSLNAAEFTKVSSVLYVFRQSAALPAYLWYSSSETCFDLVSARVVTAVCADQAVTFQWNARSACSGRGGVLAWVNGR